MDQPWFYVAWTAGAYLLGSVSAGDLVSRAAGVSIRTRGTGNPGAANIYMEIGPAHGVAVFASACTEMFGDEIDRLVRWESDAGLGTLAGSPVKLRFTLKDADVYAFRFRKA